MTIEKEMPYLAKLMSKQEWEAGDFLRVLKELTELALRRSVQVTTSDLHVARNLRHKYRCDAKTFGRPYDLEEVPRSMRANMVVHIEEV